MFLLLSILVLKALTIQTANTEKRTTNRAQMSNRQCRKSKIAVLIA